MKPVLNIKITLLSRQLMNKCILMFLSGNFHDTQNKTTLKVSENKAKNVIKNSLFIILNDIYK